MLQHINIKNFAIIENLDLELRHGMTVITGETGAGKSIVIDALDVALGDRADSRMIRHGCDRCEINLNFDVANISQAQQWLQQQDLYDDNHECLIRRITTKEGRSRNYINGSSVTLQQLRSLGERLVHVHGQHQHHAMLKREQQRILLDHYLHQPQLLNKVAELFQQWKKVKQEIESLEQQTGNHDAQVELLQYQIEELDKLAATDNEFEQLSQEHQQLANAEHLIQTCQQALEGLANTPDGSVLDSLNTIISSLSQMNVALVSPINQLLTNALIEVEEAVTELKQLNSQIEMNDERLRWIENRLSQLHDAARKHKIKPEELPAHHQQLQQQLALILNADEHLKVAKQQEQIILQKYLAQATTLSQARRKAATKLSKLVSKSLSTLGMPGGLFSIEFIQTDTPTLTGIDWVDFMVTANPGQPLQLLSKVASGGELSRISLAIQVITAQCQTTPSLVFDEVDVGIGGGTAEIVGQLLRTLGENAQVLCITHLPQVAAQGHHHLQINKTRGNDKTMSQLAWLEQDERVEEIARMLGGVKITESTLAHAREMLGLVMA